MVRQLDDPRIANSVNKKLKWQRLERVQRQVDDDMCFVAALESINYYYLGRKNKLDDTLTQNEIKEKYLREGGTLGPMGGMASVKKGMTTIGHYNGIVSEKDANNQYATLGTNNRAQLDFESITKSIDEAKPLICIMEHNVHNLQHAVVVYGYEIHGNTRLLHVGDPGMRSRRNGKVVPFEKFCEHYEDSGRSDDGQRNIDRDGYRLIKIVPTCENGRGN